jgi:hypothetical protein
MSNGGREQNEWSKWKQKKLLTIVQSEISKEKK